MGIYKPRKLRVIFDDGGGITIDCPRYCHHYNDAKQAAEDWVSLCEGTDINRWGGNEPEMRQSSYKGSKVLSKCYVGHYLKNGQYFDMGNVDGFFEALRELNKEN